MFFILIGIAAGIVGGMGIGGGTILIPALVFLAKIPQKTAQSVNLITFLPIATAALIIHTRQNRVKYGIALLIMISAIIGAIIGAKLVPFMSIEWLRRLFGAFLLIMGIYEFFRKDK